MHPIRIWSHLVAHWLHSSKSGQFWFTSLFNRSTDEQNETPTIKTKTFFIEQNFNSSKLLKKQMGKCQMNNFSKSKKFIVIFATELTVCQSSLDYQGLSQRRSDVGMCSWNYPKVWNFYAEKLGSIFHLLIYTLQIVPLPNTNYWQLVLRKILDKTWTGSSIHV